MVELKGALYIEFNMDSPCRVSDAPPELAGVTLRFRTPEGALTETVSGPIAYQLLEFGEGTAGWQYPGCRYFSPYEVALPRAESYTVTFRDAQPDNDDGTGFVGIEYMSRTDHVITLEALEANDFLWDFEVEPSYVPRH